MRESWVYQLSRWVYRLSPRVYRLAGPLSKAKSLYPNFPARASQILSLSRKMELLFRDAEIFSPSRDRALLEISMPSTI